MSARGLTGLGRATAAAAHINNGLADQAFGQAGGALNSLGLTPETPPGTTDFHIIDGTQTASQGARAGTLGSRGDMQLTYVRG